MREIPDILEQGEMRCERWADENIAGDTFHCSCGEWRPLSEAEALSADPHVIPVCRKCALAAGAGG